jgi:hypothetical protein
MRHPTRQTELQWRGPDAMRWEELPPRVREHVREQLERLLRRVAAARVGRAEAPHEP